MAAQIQALGIAGIAAYGILNSLYYTLAFLFTWVHIAQVPRGMGVLATFRKLVEVMGVVWLGSQITKTFRLAGAIVMAPFIDRILDVGSKRLRMRSKFQGFGLLVVACILISLLLFGGVVAFWA